MELRKNLFKAFATVLVSGVVLAGCGAGEEDGAENDGDGGTAATGDTIELEIYQGKVEFNDAFEELAQTYEEQNENIDITITSVGGGSDYLGTLKTKFSSGDEPDIFSIAGPTETEQFKDNLADLSDMKATELALEGSLTGVTEGDTVYGIPFNQEGYGLIYNKRIFEEAGINADDITTMEDLEAAVETLDSQKDDLGIEAVFALPAKEMWVMGNHLANAYLAPEFNHDVEEAYNSDTIAFEKSEEMKRMLDLQNDYSIQPTLSLDYSQQVEQYFALERVAIIQQGNWVYPSIEQMDPEFAENNVGIMPLPVEGYEGSLPVGIPNHWGVNNNNDEETIQAAKDFLDWMYTSDEGKEAVLKDFKFIPAYEGYDTEAIADPLSKSVYEYASEGNTIGWIFLGYPSNGWGDILGGNMQQYIDGQMTWDEVISDSTAQWEEARQ